MTGKLKDFRESLGYLLRRPAGCARMRRGGTRNLLCGEAKKETEKEKAPFKTERNERVYGRERERERK
jgi:hypothetical protein